MTTTAEKIFALKAPWIMAKLREDFAPLTPTQAAGILGNLGHECNGFSNLAESNGHGPGRGWAQWSFDRRVKFESYCNRNRLDWRIGQGELRLALPRAQRLATSAPSSSCARPRR
jgi:hypothetical protein